VLLFSRTKHNAKKIVRSIRDMGHSASEIHSNRSLAQRRDALEGFKSGKYRVLVATDIASRGIDVTGIELVLNYDLPEDAENYVHRIGRTARAGHKGHAISFATPDQGHDVRDIEKLIKATLPVSKHAELTLDKFGEASHSSSRSSGRQGSPGHSRYGQSSNGQPRHGGQAKKPYKYPKPKFYR
jgi:ATP-dependent RNA helicase RhlE